MTTNKPNPIANERPHKRQMSFKQFVASKRHEQKIAQTTNIPKGRAKLTEQNVGYADADDIHESIFASIPAQASDRDVAIELLANKLREMTETMDIALTCVGFESGNNAALPN
jgi:hypothetical protein